MATANGIPGGITNVPGAPNNVEIEHLARFAVHDYNHKNNAALVFVTVISAKTQVVSGVLYYITLMVKNGETKIVYETKVWVREWLKSKEVLEFKVVDDSIGEGIDGGVNDVPADTPHIQNLGRFAVDQYNKDENANLEFVKVIDAKLQVVEGFLYYLTLEAKNGKSKNVYEAKVWERSWINSTQLLEFKSVNDAL
ncbi:multicystatin-like isoform X2 [Vigna radiata var. radiata]|uniref:Cysteine proteinase inhibitor n=1 Tax=Vigna radiata var. radiata TaxID=3916 RepID=A0A1S3UFZ2_VIGRR|nr:multicystatin-like isoform X2 [Vigna radiata var. radiata]